VLENSWQASIPPSAVLFSVFPILDGDAFHSNHLHPVDF
jgi:hypothetical protein